MHPVHLARPISPSPIFSQMMKLLVPAAALASIVAATEPIPDPLVCSVHGDPHVEGFGNQPRCDLFGIGLFTLVSLPGVEAQAFFCPPPRVIKDPDLAKRSKLMASYMSAIAIRTGGPGGEQVKMIGHTVTTGNGTTLGVGDWHVGADVFVKVRDNPAKHAQFFNLYAKDLFVNVASIAEPRAAAGYLENFKIEVPAQPIEGYCPNACATPAGEIIQSVSRQNGPKLFSQADITLLMNDCSAATFMDDAITCGKKPSNCNVCHDNKISCDLAQKLCTAGCVGGDAEMIEDCVFDYCEMGGADSAIASCAANAVAIDTK